MVPPHPAVPSLNGHTDTVPDIVGRLGRPIDLAIFTEGNHFPALLGGEIIEPFRAWARAQREYAALALENITVVTLPQPMIVGILVGSGVSLGNLTLEVSRASGFYPDIVMGGAAPLAQLHKGSIVGVTARVFARNRGFSLVVAAGNPLAVRTLEDLARPGMRVVLASASEPGARQQYISAIEALIGEEAARSILAREVVTFPGRLGIQHRDVLQAMASRSADAGIIFHHLARYFGGSIPTAVHDGHRAGSGSIRFADRDGLFGRTIARASGQGLLGILFGVAREVYPRYGFATISEAEFGAPVKLN
jgi:hypothetical protein